MIETLFTANNTNMVAKDNGRRPIMVSLVQENRVLDPKKSQNIAILLRALNVTIDEVCEALLEGNWRILLPLCLVLLLNRYLNLQLYLCL